MDLRIAIVVLLWITSSVKSSEFIPKVELELWKRISRTTDFLMRNRRDANNLEKSVEKMKMLARIVNGIYLQKGFIDGSIPPGKFISELFHLSVLPSDINSINIEENSLDAMKYLPSELQKFTNFEKVENLFSALEMILKEIDGIGSIKNWKEKESFKKDIEGLATNGIDFKSIRKIGSALNTWIFHTEKLTSEKLTNPEAFGAFSSLLKQIQAFKTSFSEMTSIAPTIKFTTIKTAFEPLIPLLKALKGIQQHQKNAGILQTISSVVKDYQMNLESISLVAEKLKHQMKDLMSTQSLVNSRIESNQSFEYTHGFLEGASDLKLISQDLKDPWIRNVTRNKDFSKSLQPLNKLEDLSSGIESSFKSSIHQADLQRINGLTDFSFRISEISEKRNEIENSMSTIDSCGYVGANSINDKILMEIMNNATQIDRLMTEMKGFLQQLTTLAEDFQNSKILDEILLITQKATSVDTVQTVVEEYKNYKKLSELNKMIGDLNELVNGFLKPVDKPDKLIELAKGIQDKFGDLDTYLQEFGKFSDFFVCLQNHKDLKLVIRTTKTVKEFREMEKKDLDEVVDNGVEVVKKVVKMNKKLNELNELISDIKGTQETVFLQKFNDVKKHSKVIGSATRGIVIMRNWVNQKKLDLNVDRIMEMVNTIFPPLDRNDVDNLNAVIVLKSKIKVTYDSLDQFQNSIQNLNSSILTDYSDVFEKAEKVTGIEDDLSKIVGSLEKLIEQVTEPADKNELEVLKMNLKEIDDLHFSKYSQDFKDTRGSLEALDLFFVSLGKLKPPLPNAASQNISSGISETSTNSSGNQTIYETILLYLFISLFGLCFLAAIVYGIYYFFFKKKYKLINDTDNDDNNQMTRSKTSTAISTLESGLHPVPSNNETIKSTTNQTNSNVGSGNSTENNVKNGGKECRETNKTNATNSLKLDETQKLERKMTKKHAIDFLVHLRQQMNNYPLKTEIEKVVNYTTIFCSMISSVFTSVAMNVTAETDYQKPFRNEYRFTAALADNTKVVLTDKSNRFKTKFMHANRANFETGPGMIVCQEPKLETIEKFFWMAKENKTTDIFMLCVMYEQQQYFPDKKNETKRFGKVQVTCTSKQELYKSAYIIRKLKIEFDGEKPFFITHHHYLKWTDRMAPKDATIVNELRSKMRACSTPPIVHCTDGVGRSGCILLMENLYNMICNEEKKTLCLIDVLKSTRDIRANSVDKAIQFAFCIYAVVVELTTNFKLDKASLKYSEDIQNGFLNFYENQELLRKKDPIEEGTDDDARRDRRRIFIIENGKNDPPFKMTIDCNKLLFKYASDQQAYENIKMKNTTTKKQVFWTNTINRMYSVQPSWGTIEKGEEKILKVTYKNILKCPPPEGDLSCVKISHAGTEKRKLKYEEVLKLEVEGAIFISCNHCAELVDADE